MDDFRLETEALVIGSGIAGCVSALTLADQGLEVTLLTSGDDLDDGNTALAQGGIVYQALDEDPRVLEKDIISAGRGHNHVRAVRHVCRKGPEAVTKFLVERLGVPFAKTTDCEWDLAMEGGHEAGRILHCGDYTGRAIMDGLMRAVKATSSIKILTGRTAVDLLTSHHHAQDLNCLYQLGNQCVGAYVFNEHLNQVETVLSEFTVLATGGLGRLFLHTTNSASSIGSGLTMAQRAGARILNTEFIQFHPTALFHRSDRRFLISEAVRGAGAKLIDKRGNAFMTRYDQRADLAPRDVVTRAIMDEMLASGEDCIYLDAANHLNQDPEKRFPTIFRTCLEQGVDMRKEPIPVVPAAHYSCGGVQTDLRGRTTLDRLYAVGECSCTGVHGANRLASVSLLEGLLWGQSAGEDIARRLKGKSASVKRIWKTIPDWESPGAILNEDPALIAQDWSALRHTMWNYVGIARSTQRLRRAFEDMRTLTKQLTDFYKGTPLSKSLVDLYHGSQAAYIVTLAALRNKKSRGCHFRVD
jgi:L-aspartate oxidase